MENNIYAILNGAFIFIVCIIHEWKAIRRKAEFNELFVFGAFMGFSIFSIGVVGVISHLTGGF